MLLDGGFPPATPLPPHISGPEALRHCLTTVLPMNCSQNSELGRHLHAVAGLMFHRNEPCVKSNVIPPCHRPPGGAPCPRRKPLQAWLEAPTVERVLRVVVPGG